MFKILTLNNIAKAGLTEFASDTFQVSDNVQNPDAILVRSYDMHQYELPASLQVIGRAGAGTNNIPVGHCSELGIPVLNAPGANANAVKELVLTGMLLACRNIYPALRYTKTLQGDDKAIHEQVEKHKKQFAGFELPDKTLGIIGLGNIGVKVANAAHHLGMKVIGFDPAITVRAAWELHASVTKADNIDDIIRKSDFISLHVPLNDKTRNLITAEHINHMRKHTVLLNFARDGIVDNHALLDALNNDKILYYVCDFPNQLFQDHPKVIALPHLGASTKEAEKKSAIMVVEQIKEFLTKGHILNAVNFPNIKLTRNEGYRLAITNRNVPNMVAQISQALSGANINIIDMINKSQQDFAYNLLDVNQLPSAELLNTIRHIEGVVRVRVIETA